MSDSRMLSRLVLVALVAVLIAAPASSAMPAGLQGNDAAVFDARGEAAASGGGTGAAAVNGPFNHPSFPGPPAFPDNPTPLPPRAVPVTGVSGGDGGGVDLPVVLLIIAGTLAIGGGMALAANRFQTRTAH